MKKVTVSLRAIAGAIGAAYKGDIETETRAAIRHLWVCNKPGDDAARVVATDGHRLFMAGTDTDGVPESEADLCLPITLAEAILSQCTRKGYWPEAQVELIYSGEAGHGQVSSRFINMHMVRNLRDVQLTANWPMVNVPDWRLVVPKKFEAAEWVGFNAEYLAEMVEAASAFLGGGKVVGLKIHVGGAAAPAMVQVDSPDAVAWEAVLMPMRI